MGKNVTVQVGDDLAAKMEKLLDANWSQVVRDCLDRYCDIRLNPNIEALMQKMKVQKEEAYAEGYKAALEWFKLEEVRYADVNQIFRNLDEVESDFDRRVREEYGDWEHAQDENPVIGEEYEREIRRFWNDVVEEQIKGLPDSYDISDAFVEGFEAALKKLGSRYHEAIEKVI